MPPVASLTLAAQQAPEALLLLWQADTLQADVIAFYEQALAAVPSDIPNNLPLANWIAVIAAFAPSIQAYGAVPTINGSLAAYEVATDYVFRFYKLAAYLSAQGLITAGQATALLAAYNDNLATP